MWRRSGLGVAMKRLTRTLVKRSEQAFTLAIEVFNKPTIELDESGGIRLQEPNVLGNLTPAERVPDSLPPVAAVPEVSGWLHEQTLKVFIDEVRGERLGEIDRIAEHVELSLTELLQKADEEIGRAASDQGPGAEGRLAQAEARHAELKTRFGDAVVLVHGQLRPEVKDAAMERFSRQLAEETGALPPPGVVVEAIKECRSAEPRKIGDAVRAYYRRRRARPMGRPAPRPQAEPAPALAGSASA